MNRPIILRNAARKDVADAYAWYEDRQPGLGDRFLLEVQQGLRHVALSLGGVQRIHAAFRQAPLNDFPYVLIYRTTRTQIVVMRVFHTSQHPKRKFGRK